MDIEQLTAFLAWCTVINVIVLVLSALALWSMGCHVVRLHSRMFGLSENAVCEQYFRFFATYKILIVMFNLVPYLALRII